MVANFEYGLSFPLHQMIQTCGVATTIRSHKITETRIKFGPLLGIVFYLSLFIQSQKSGIIHPFFFLGFISVINNRPPF